MVRTQSEKFENRPKWKVNVEAIHRLPLQLFADPTPMARRQGPVDPLLPFHVTARCINREWFDLPMARVWELMSLQLYFIHHAFKFEILSFVLMHNHFHLLCRAPQDNLSEALAYFMRETSRELARLSKRINQTYGGRFFRSSLSSHHYFLNAYKYVYRNPVTANLCVNVQDYPWSTLHGLLGRSPCLIPLADDTTLFADPEGTLNWLNKPVEQNDWQAVRKALRRKSFKLASNRNTRKPHHLEIDLI